jgi:hypothetical protein
LATAGFAPSEIKPTVILPSDFDAFWDINKKELANNNITAPKNLVISLETGHYIYPETNAKLTDWLLEKLKK